MPPAAALTGDDLQGAEGRWYSVEEAAGYLGVSRPTIFRWMKEGIISFYKVGNATRFRKEGLDAVVEKTTGQKEAEASAGRCAVCGHGVLIDGEFRGLDHLFFYPRKTRFWTFKESRVPIKTKVCAACGYIHTHVDTDHLNRLLPPSEAAMAAEQAAETTEEAATEGESDSTP